VFRNLLQIRGISTATATKICFLLGISCSTVYSKLSTHKIDQLNLLLSIYKKKTSPFHFNVLINDVNSLFLSPNSNPVGTTPPNTIEVQGPRSEAKILHSPILTNLDEFKKDNLKVLITLNTYRGRRFKNGYPVKGQRTRSNGATARRLNRIKL
jgi:ribosomal protein S13